MRAHEFIIEANQNQVGFTALQAIEKILGANNITTNKESAGPGKIVVMSTGEFKPGAAHLKNLDKVLTVRYPSTGLYDNMTCYYAPAHSYSPGGDIDHVTGKYVKLPEVHEPEQIAIPDTNSQNAAYIAPAVHEAYHAYIYRKAGGQGTFYSNEAVVNKLAEKWLRQHITGFALHIALTVINNSRISYKNTYGSLAKTS